MQKNRQTALLGRGASAPHKRFHRRGKPWRRGGFADPEHSNANGSETQKMQSEILESQGFAGSFAAVIEEMI